MSTLKDFFLSSGCKYKLLLSTSKIKPFISYGLLALIALNNSIAPSLAQNKSPSTSPSYVAPQGGVRTLETPSCSNNVSFGEHPLDTAITTQYSSKGIIFGGSSPFITEDGANPTSPVLSGSPRFVGAIEGTFVDPSDGVTPITAGNFQLDAGYFDSVGSTALKLYDSEGNLLEQRTNTGLGIFTFTVEGLPVAKWRIEPVGDEPAGFAIDNVCFTLETAKEFVRQYPDYLRDGDTLAGVPETDFPESERPLPAYVIPAVTPQSQVDEEYIEQEEVPTSQTNAGSAPISSDAIDTGIVVAELSCLGIGRPLNQKTLLELGKKVNPQASKEEIDKAFERFTLDSIMLPLLLQSVKFPSPERYEKTKKKSRIINNVTPEAVTTVVVETYRNKILVNKALYPNSAFYDAKALKKGKIILGTGNFQIQGYLDYLSHYSDAAKASLFVPKSKRPRGHLTLMTTSEVSIGDDVLNYTGTTQGPGTPFTPVAVTQMVACVRNTGNDYTTDYLQMGRGILLNGNRFLGYPPVSPSPAGRPSSLKFR